MAAEERIPVTVLTGYLGAGKTTLLNRILSGDHARRYAVIVNEFGEIGIDHDLILRTDEELLEMSNGCICCTVRGDLVRTLHSLLSKQRRFDALIVETTGLAAPGPVAQTFIMDAFLQARTALDSITAVVDARHILLRLADSREAREQVAFADQIVLNKTELLQDAPLLEIEGRLRQLNRLAPIYRAERSNVPLDRILGRGGFDLERIASLGPDLDLREDDHVHDEHCSHEHDHHHDHGHDGDIVSVSLASHTPLDGEKASAWLQHLVDTRGEDLLRSKGILDVRGDERRFVFQSVHRLLEGDFQRPWQPGEARYSRLVFIGRNLDRDSLQRGFASCA